MNLLNPSIRHKIRTPPFWLKTKWWLCPPTNRPTTLLATLFFFVVPKDESGFEREAFCWSWRGSTTITGGSWPHFRWKILDNVSRNGSDFSFVDTCHVVGTLCFYKYWPFDRFQPNLKKKKKQIRAITNVSLLIKSRILNVFPRLTNIWQADKWLGCEQYLSVRLEGEWPSTRLVGTRTQSPSKHLASAGSINVCYKIRRANSPKIRLAPGTVHNYWHICQTHQSWESGLKRWKNMNYVRRLNVLS